MTNLSHNDVICLALLEKLETFRQKLESGEIQAGCADWVVRMCQANVADYTQFNDRVSWLREIPKNEPEGGE